MTLHVFSIGLGMAFLCILPLLVTAIFDYAFRSNGAGAKLEDSDNV